MKEVESLAWDKACGAAMKRYISSNTPVVVKGLADFPPLNWSIDSLEKRYGDVPIRVVVSDSQHFAYDDKRERTIVQMTLSEFLDRGIRSLGADGKYYVLGKSPAEQFPGLMNEIKLPEQLLPFISGMGLFLEKNIWMSHGGTRTALHFDTQDNFNIQIEGEKIFWLYPPRIDGMYTYNFYSQASYVSPVDPRHLDRERFPLFPNPEDGFEVALKPGDMLYLPYGWWHQVDTTGEQNLNVNFWWVPYAKLLPLWQQSLRGAAVLAHRLGAHPHKRAQKLAAKVQSSAETTRK
jgi:hypothetical protein